MKNNFRNFFFNILFLFGAGFFSLVFVSPLLALEHEPSWWDKRAQREEKWREEGLSLIPYKANYFFPFTYNTSPHSTTSNNADHDEAKFQFSVKVLLADYFFHPDVHLYFGYTQLSMWQVYDRERSAPFRDINHEPEVIVSFDTNRHWDEFILRQTEVGLSHQSNGVGDPDSRSWNRLYANFQFDYRNVAFEIKPWYRIPDSESHDNSDISHYMGYGEFVLSYFRKNHVWSVLFRNNLRMDNNRGAIELSYSFPLTRTLTGLFQYFSGYGESLIDYNRSNNRFSIGLALSNF